MRNILRKSLFSFAIIVGLLWINNTSVFVKIPKNQTPKLIAHRGVHQVYSGDNRAIDTCRATEIEEPTHNYIENTIPSMSAAFEYGADVVEIDVHLTLDNVFAVFHDWTLDCQTNGTGVTNKQNFEALDALDVGYNFSTDGVTFPFRGHGIGMIPRLAEVFQAELDGKYLVNFKSRRKSEGKAMAELLKDPSFEQQVYGVYGGAPPTREALKWIDGMRGYDRQSLKLCLGKYMLVGWSGFVPHECQKTIVAIPSNYAPFLWGWPHKFYQRMSKVETDVILWGPYDGSGFSSGLDDPKQLDQVPEKFGGYIWTNKIEVIGPLVKQRP